jgi:hypothetical protein
MCVVCSDLLCMHLGGLQVDFEASLINFCGRRCLQYIQVHMYIHTYIHNQSAKLISPGFAVMHVQANQARLWPGVSGWCVRIRDLQPLWRRGSE